MRNIDRIKHIGVRRLAEMMVHEQSKPDYGYNYEEELEYIGEQTWYVSPDGMKAYSLEDAIEHTIEWLESEEELEVEEC